MYWDLLGCIGIHWDAYIFCDIGIEMNCLLEIIGIFEMVIVTLYTCIMIGILLGY